MSRNGARQITGGVAGRQGRSLVHALARGTVTGRVRVAFAFVLLACALPGKLPGAPQRSAQELYAVAADKLASGKPEEATGLFEEAIEQLGRVTDVLALQLGNAHAYGDEPGKAALWYARALRANPDLGEARQNLGVVLRRTGALEFDAGWPAALGRVISPGLTAGVAAGLAWLALLLMAWRIRRSLVANLQVSVGGVLPLPLLLLATGLLLWQLVYTRQAEVYSGILGDAIVVGREASLHTGPDASSARLIELPPGSQLRLDMPRGGWSYVEAPGDLHGWVRSELLEPLEYF